MTVVLDSWALMRLLEGSEPTASLVQERLDAGDAIVNWINLGEVHYVLHRAEGRAAATRTIADIEAVVTTVLPDRELVIRAAEIKAKHPLSYADAFAAATAARFDAPLWTGDPELLLDDVGWSAVNPT